jgi:hypothetical protein
VESSGGPDSRRFFPLEVVNSGRPVPLAPSPAAVPWVPSEAPESNPDPILKAKDEQRLRSRTEHAIERRSKVPKRLYLRQAWPFIDTEHSPCRKDGKTSGAMVALPGLTKRPTQFVKT